MKEANLIDGDIIEDTHHRQWQALLFGISPIVRQMVTEVLTKDDTRVCKGCLRDGCCDMHAVLYFTDLRVSS